MESEQIEKRLENLQDQIHKIQSLRRETEWTWDPHICSHERLADITNRHRERLDYIEKVQRELKAQIEAIRLALVKLASGWEVHDLIR